MKINLLLFWSGHVSKNRFLEKVKKKLWKSTIKVGKLKESESIDKKFPGKIYEKNGILS